MFIRGSTNPKNCYMMLFLLLLLHQIGKGLLQMFDITEQTFEQFTKDKDIMLIEFIMPWCKHCQQLQPEWEKASQILAGNREYVLGKVNCWESGKSLCDKVKIPMYPEIRLYRHGVYVESYEGERNAGAILDYVQRAQTTTGRVGSEAGATAPPVTAVQQPPTQPPLQQQPIVQPPPQPQPPYPYTPAPAAPAASAAQAAPAAQPAPPEQPKIEAKVEAKPEFFPYQSLVPPPPMVQPYEPPAQSFIQTESAPAAQQPAVQYPQPQPLIPTASEQRDVSPFYGSNTQQQVAPMYEDPHAGYNTNGNSNNINNFWNSFTNTPEINNYQQQTYSKYLPKQKESQQIAPTLPPVSSQYQEPISLQQPAPSPELQSAPVSTPQQSVPSVATQQILLPIYLQSPLPAIAQVQQEVQSQLPSKLESKLEQSEVAGQYNNYETYNQKAEVSAQPQANSPIQKYQTGLKSLPKQPSIWNYVQDNNINPFSNTQYLQAPPAPTNRFTSVQTQKPYLQNYAPNTQQVKQPSQSIYPHPYFPPLQNKWVAEYQRQHSLLNSYSKPISYRPVKAMDMPPYVPSTRNEIKQKTPYIIQNPLGYFKPRPIFHHPKEYEEYNSFMPLNKINIAMVRSKPESRKETYLTPSLYSSLMLRRKQLAARQPKRPYVRGHMISPKKTPVRIAMARQRYIAAQKAKLKSKGYVKTFPNLHKPAIEALTTHAVPISKERAAQIAKLRAAKSRQLANFNRQRALYNSRRKQNAYTYHMSYRKPMPKPFAYAQQQRMPISPMFYKQHLPHYNQQPMPMFYNNPARSHYSKSQALSHLIVEEPQTDQALIRTKVPVHPPLNNRNPHNVQLNNRNSKKAQLNNRNPQYVQLNNRNSQNALLRQLDSRRKHFQQVQKYDKTILKPFLSSRIGSSRPTPLRGKTRQSQYEAIMKSRANADKVHRANLSHFFKPESIFHATSKPENVNRQDFAKKSSDPQPHVTYNPKSLIGFWDKLYKYYSKQEKKTERAPTATTTKPIGKISEADKKELQLVENFLESKSNPTLQIPSKLFAALQEYKPGIPTNRQTTNLKTIPTETSQESFMQHEIQPYFVATRSSQPNLNQPQSNGNRQQPRGNQQQQQQQLQQQQQNQQQNVQSNAEHSNPSDASYNKALQASLSQIGGQPSTDSLQHQLETLVNSEKQVEKFNEYVKEHQTVPSESWNTTPNKINTLYQAESKESMVNEIHPSKVGPTLRRNVHLLQDVSTPHQQIQSIHSTDSELRNNPNNLQEIGPTQTASSQQTVQSSKSQDSVVNSVQEVGPTQKRNENDAANPQLAQYKLPVVANNVIPNQHIETGEDLHETGPTQRRNEATPNAMVLPESLKSLVSTDIEDALEDTHTINPSNKSIEMDIPSKLKEVEPTQRNELGTFTTKTQTTNQARQSVDLNQARQPEEPTQGHSLNIPTVLNNNLSIQQEQSRQTDEPNQINSPNTQLSRASQTSFINPSKKSQSEQATLDYRELHSTTQKQPSESAQEMAADSLLHDAELVSQVPTPQQTIRPSEHQTRSQTTRPSEHQINIQTQRPSDYQTTNSQTEPPPVHQTIIQTERPSEYQTKSQTAVTQVKNDPTTHIANEFVLKAISRQPEPWDKRAKVTFKLSKKSKIPEKPQKVIGVFGSLRKKKRKKKKRKRSHDDMEYTDWLKQAETHIEIT